MTSGHSPGKLATRGLTSDVGFARQLVDWENAVIESASQDCQRSELRLSSIFKDVSDEVLESLVVRGKTLALKSGDPVLFQDVRGGHGLFVLLSGSIGVYRKSAASATQKIGLLKPGDCLGEYSLLDNQPMSATAAALEPSRLFFLPKAQFLAVIERDPNAGCVLYRNLATYLVVRLRMYAEMHPREAIPGRPDTA